MPNMTEQKQGLLLSTIRLVSSMINVLQNEEASSIKELLFSLSAVELLREGLHLNKDIQLAVRLYLFIPPL
jgi:hypothetical protein